MIHHRKEKKEKTKNTEFSFEGSFIRLRGTLRKCHSFVRSRLLWFRSSGSCCTSCPFRSYHRCFSFSFVPWTLFRSPRCSLFVRPTGINLFVRPIDTFHSLGCSLSFVSYGPPIDLVLVEFCEEEKNKKKLLKSTDVPWDFAYAKYSRCKSMLSNSL